MGFDSTNLAKVCRMRRQLRRLRVVQVPHLANPVLHDVNRYVAANNISFCRRGGAILVLRHTCKCVVQKLPSTLATLRSRVRLPGGTWLRNDSGQVV